MTIAGGPAARRNVLAGPAWLGARGGRNAADAASDAVKGVWDSIKWWLLGGVVVVIAVGILVVYVNGRSRRTQVVQASPVSEA